MVPRFAVGEAAGEGHSFYTVNFCTDQSFSKFQAAAIYTRGAGWPGNYWLAGRRYGRTPWTPRYVQ